MTANLAIAGDDPKAWIREEISLARGMARELRRELPFWANPPKRKADEVYRGLPTTRGHYRTLVVDPPWNYEDKHLPGHGRGAASHYDLLSTEDVAALPVGGLAAPDAHLYVWFTNSFVLEAYHLARWWGFTPKTVVTWVKTRKGVTEAEEPGDCAFGMGHYFRGATEHALFAVRGKAPPLNRSTRNVVFAPLRGHSVKPEEFYQMVREVSPGPRIDLFARRPIEGFDVWGNEVGA